MTAVLLFLDRSVGTRRIAGALRTADLDVETIADRYGAANTHVPDELWIAEASRDGRILLSADKRIRYRPLERSAICRNAARCLTFAAGDLTADQMIALFLHHLPRVRIVAEDSGPYVYHLTRDGLVRMNSRLLRIGAIAVGRGKSVAPVGGDAYRTGPLDGRG